MKLNDLQPMEGAHKPRERAGRGISAGRGKTAGRGQKGQGARSGGTKRPYFEGGQLPLVRRLPHLRGFTNIWRVEFSPINVERLNRFTAGDEITPEALVSAGLIKSATELVKILGGGDLDRALTVKAHKFSASAREKILAAGGTVAEIDLSLAAKSRVAESRALGGVGGAKSRE
jgi:large subunit ribosomal protein L15